MFRKLSVLTALMILAVCCLNGCGKKEAETESSKDYVYEETVKEFQGLRGDVLSFARNEEGYYVCTYEEQTEDSFVTTLYQVDEDGNELNSYLISSDKDADVLVSGILAADENKIYIVKDEYDNRTDTVDSYIEMIDGNGNVLNNVNLKDLSDGSESFVDAQIDNNGMIAIEFEDKISVLDSELNHKGNIPIQAGIYKMSVSKDGDILALEEKSGMLGGGKLDVMEIDTNALKCNTVASINNDYINFSGILMRGNKYDFYYKSSNGIYGYDINEKKEYKVMDLAASYLSLDNTEYFESLMDGRFYDIYLDNDEQKVFLSTYEKVDPESLKDRTVITYGGIFIDEEVKKEALKFNRQNKDYQIVFKDYAEEVSGTEDPAEKMSLDISAGNIPDIIDLSIASIKEYENKDLLEDLSEYIDKDEVLDKEDFLDNIWDAMLIDGKLYFAASGVYLSSLVGNSDTVGDKNSVSINDIYNINQKCKDDQTIFGPKSKDEIMHEFFRMGAGEFIDEENKKSNFDSDDFKTLLKFCNENGQDGKKDNINESDEIEAVKEGKIFFTERTVIKLENIILLNDILGDKVRFVGYPGKDSGYSYFRFNNAIGISAASEYKEEAWKFVRTFFSKEHQGKLENGNIPLRKDCFEMMKKAYTAEDEYVDELGNRVHPIEGRVQFDEIIVDLRPLTEKEMNVYAELITNTNRCMDMDDTIPNIIYEESKLYFDGKKSLDETVQVIQNRAQTYLDENK